jgi:hypothetical protein
VILDVGDGTPLNDSGSFVVVEKGIGKTIVYPFRDTETGLHALDFGIVDEQGNCRLSGRGLWGCSRILFSVDSSRVVREVTSRGARMPHNTIREATRRVCEQHNIFLQVV